MSNKKSFFVQLLVALSLTILMLVGTPISKADGNGTMCDRPGTSGGGCVIAD